MGDGGPRTQAAGTGLAAVGVAAFAIACCAGVPLVLGALAGIALGALFGVTAGVVVLAAVAVAVIRVKHDRQRDPASGGPSERSGA